MISTVEPPIKDPLRRGHNKNNLSTKDTFQSQMLIFPLIHSEPLKRGQPLNKRQNGWPQRVLYSEVPLYIISILLVYY